jgi:conjugative transfer pilus assembly protein TraH
MKNNTFMRKAVSVAVAFSVMLIPVASYPADFMDNFFSSGGAQYNVTPAGVYQGNSLNVITGGGIVYKAPQRNFQPYYFTPPSLKAGCGGIDVFLGSFGLPSKSEFVAFMRNIGQNLPGLAFKLALQELSPDFQAMMEQIRASLQKYTQDYTDSCKDARKILDGTGASAWLIAQGEKAKNALRSSGGSGDQSSADEQTKADFKAVEDNVPDAVLTDPSDGTNKTFTKMVEVNLTWYALNSGKLKDMDDAEKEFFMSIMGSTIYRKTGDTADSGVIPIQIGGGIPATVLLGKYDDTKIENLELWTCDTTEKCISPTKVTDTTGIVPMSAKMYNIAKKVRDSVMARSVNYASSDLVFLQSASSVPLLKLIMMTTYSKYSAFSEDMLIVWSEVAAYEMVTRYLEDVASQCERILDSAKKGAGLDKHMEDGFVQLHERARALRTEMMARRNEIDNKFQKTQATMAILQNVERAMKGSISADISKNLGFRG